MIYSNIIKPFFFLFSPEKAHTLTMSLLKMTTKIPFGKSILKSFFVHELKEPIQAFGLNFKNPIGLAAGFDKNAKYLEELQLLGFGFVEVGTVTPLPQPGNPQPRLFRLKKDNAIINRMGFNNEGVDAMVERLKNRPKGLIVGGNIGKNKNTPNENAIDDYIICFEKLFPYVDYFVVNVSSPNTPGLRELQEKGPLLEILNTLQKRNESKSAPKPILLKIAPDLTIEQLDDIDEIVKISKIAGLIATNTTIDRDKLITSDEIIANIGNGGLSGLPVFRKSTDVLSYLSKKSNKLYPIIGVGGIENENHLKEKKMNGAVLVQIYTGLIYKGPSLIKTLSKAW